MTPISIKTAATILGVTRQAVHQKVKNLQLPTPLLMCQLVELACLSGFRGREPKKESQVARRRQIANSRRPVAEELLPQIVEMIEKDSSDPRATELFQQIIAAGA